MASSTQAEAVILFMATSSRWNAATEVVPQLGYDCPVFRRTKQWLENETSRKISCLSFGRLPFYKGRESQFPRLRSNFRFADIDVSRSI
jgi:hypothetical protein